MAFFKFLKKSKDKHAPEPGALKAPLDFPPNMDMPPSADLPSDNPPDVGPTHPLDHPGAPNIPDLPAFPPLQGDNIHGDMPPGLPPMPDLPPLPGTQPDTGTVPAFPQDKPPVLDAPPAHGIRPTPESSFHEEPAPEAVMQAVPEAPPSEEVPEMPDIPPMPEMSHMPEAPVQEEEAQAPAVKQEVKQQAAEEAPAPERIVDISKPLFIKVHDYAHVIDTITAVKSNIKECNDALSKISEISKQESVSLSAWKVSIETAQKSLMHADAILFKK